MLNQQSSPPNLLLTKTLLPIARSKQVQRSRLIKLLASDSQRSVTLISAPAGYGKTTLLSQWLATVKEAEQHVAWVSLDEFDNEPARFWGYICEGLIRVSPSLEIVLLGVRKQDVPPVECPLITVLINEIGRLNTSVTLVLDDYHVIDNPKIHVAVDFLIHHLPPNFKVIISTRVEPPFLLTRLRASGKVQDIKIFDLQFNLEETNIYLNQMMNLYLTPQNVRRLSDLTWGWITELQLAAISLRDQQDINSLLAGIKSENRYILDFLFEEVFYRQGEDVKDFLLKTSILDKFNASLCNAVTGYNDSSNRLDHINRANLFVSAIDETGQWYRYHPLFSELLQRELSRNSPEIIPELHKNASAWYGDNGFIEQAISHSLVARDYNRVEQLLQQDFWIATNQLLWHDHILLRKWLDRLPAEILENSPAITMLMLWGDISQSRFNEIDFKAPTIQEKLHNQNGRMDQNESFVLETGLNTIQACTFMLCGEYSRSIQLAEQTLEKVGRNAFFFRSFLFWTLAESYERLGHINKAYNLLSETIALSNLADGTLLSSFCTYEMGRIQVINGNLNKARQTYERGLNNLGDIKNSGWHPILVGLFTLGLGRLYIEWNQLEIAENEITRGVALVGSQCPLDWVLEAQIALANLKQARNEMDEALKILTRSYHIANSSVVPREVESQILIELCKINLRMGKIYTAKHHEKNLEKRTQPSDLYYSIILQLLQIRIWISEKQFDGLIEKFELLQSRCFEANLISLALEIMILEAVYLDTMGETSSAINQIMKALALAQPEKYIYPFLRENGIYDLLVKIPRNQKHPQNQSETVASVENYIQVILKAARKLDANDLNLLPVSPKPADSLVEQLTDREIEILRLIAKGTDRKAIARTLHISGNTIKTHFRNIYGKLGAHNLLEAIQLATKHDLL